MSRPMNSIAVRRKGSRRCGDFCFPGQGSCNGENGHDVGKAAEEHRDAERGVVPGRIRGKPSEGRAVVAGGGRVGVENFRQSARSCVGQTRQCKRKHGRRCGEPEDGQRQDEDRQHRELHLPSFDLLAEVLRRSADHQSGNEDGEDGHDDNAIEARPDAAGQESRRAGS